MRPEDKTAARPETKRGARQGAGPKARAQDRVGPRLGRLAKLWDLLGSALLAALLGASLTLTLLDALSLSFTAGRVTLVCALCALACALVLVNRLTAYGALLLAALGAALCLVRQINPFAPLMELADTILALASGGAGSIQDHSAVILVVLSAVLTILSFLLARMFGGIYPALTLSVLILMAGWFFQSRLNSAYIVPGLVALAVLFARSRPVPVPYARAFSIALIAVLLATWTIPAGEPTWPPLERAADKVRELFSDYFMFTDPRTAYTVGRDGFQPNGELLGGPASPHEGAIMRVETEAKLYLRGSIRRTYTGSSWVDSALNNRYLYIDPTRQALKNAIYNLDKLPALGNALTLREVRVTMLSEGTSTLFVPNYLRSMSLPFDLVTYFNDNGEVFITRGVEPGDAYGLTAYTLPDAYSQLAEAFARAEQADDAAYQAARNDYLYLPAGLESGVYWLTQEVVAGAQTPLDKALAIQRHLLANYAYTLAVDYPSRSRDFVSAFLLTDKEGYCTYFASAMAVMARMADLPSRYVEGYLVPAEEGGTTVVHGRNAHAWVEIYFCGIGWIPFDATPGNEIDDPEGGDRQADLPPGGGTPTPTPADGPPAHGNTPTPTPGEPTPAAPEQPSPTPDESGAQETPTPAPDDAGQMTPTPTPAGDDAPDEEQARNERAGRMWLAILLLLLLLLALALWLRRRLRATRPEAVAAKLDDASLRLMVWYRAQLTLVKAQGQMPRPGETPAMFARRLLEDGDAPEEFLQVARQVAYSRYAGARPSPEALAQAAHAHQIMEKRLPRLARLRIAARRALRGFEDYRRIP